jgi:hypothetical protein
VPAFETVVIEQRKGRYEVVQGEQVLLTVPAPVFQAYEVEAVFPPAWEPREPSHGVRRLFWNPDTAEFFMAGLEAHPARTAEAWGSTPYRSYLQGFWIPAPPVLLLRPYWNPADPYDPFDAPARRRSLAVQSRFREILRGLRPPSGWAAILNATDPYLDALGVSAPGASPDPEEIRELSLTPPAALSLEAAAGVFDVVATEHAGKLFPVIREDALAAVHSLTLAGLHTAQALLDRAGLPHQEGPFRPH